MPPLCARRPSCDTERTAGSCGHGPFVPIRWHQATRSRSCRGCTTAEVRGATACGATWRTGRKAALHAEPPHARPEAVPPKLPALTHPAGCRCAPPQDRPTRRPAAIPPAPLLPALPLPSHQPCAARCSGGRGTCNSSASPSSMRLGPSAGLSADRTKKKKKKKAKTV